MDFIKLLSEITISDRALAGGKGASLGTLTQADFSVPEGFVLLTAVFENFLMTNALVAKRDELKKALEAGHWQEAEGIAENLHQQILASPMPEALEKYIDDAYAQLGAGSVAVRSSAVEEDETHAAWAGVLSTYLQTDSQLLLTNIKRCWASLFTEQVIHYLQSHANTTPDLSIAVIVQSMVESEIAGVAFSIHPVTLDNSQIMIEAAAGLGEDLVSGAVTPDNYIVDKHRWQIADKSISFQKTATQKAKNGSIHTLDIHENQSTKLNDQQVIALAKKVAAIEEKYGMPVDVEWAWANQKFYILQSRPVSNLGTLAPDNLSSQIVEYEFWWSDHLAYWAHDVGLNVLDIHRDILWNQYDDFLVYIKDGTAFGYLSKKDMEGAQKRGEIYLQSDYLPILEKVCEECVSGHKHIYSVLNKCSYLEMSNSDISQLFLKTIDVYSPTISHYKASGPLATKHLYQALSQYFSEEELHILSLPTHLDIMNLEQMDWLELIKQPFSETRLLEHAAKHAWFFMSHFTYGEVIETLTQLFHESKEQQVTNDILSEKQKLQEEQQVILQGHEESLPLVHLWQAISTYRIALKGCWASVDFHLIPMLDEICRRSGETLRDITRYYRVEDIVRLLDSEEQLAETEKVRRENGTLGIWSNGEFSYYFGQEAEKIYQEKVDHFTSSDSIQGMVANRGNVSSVSGKARILECNNAAQARELGESFQEGDILVTPMAQLNIWHIIKRASAIVTDEGGMLSHAAIVARESNIPCIVGTGSATFLIKDGDTITVDLMKGIVHLAD